MAAKKLRKAALTPEELDKKLAAIMAAQPKQVATWRAA
jgi:hypothetical protein